MSLTFINKQVFRVIFFCTLFLNKNVLIAQTTTEKVNQLLNKEMQEQKIPGVQLVVIKNNKIVLSENKGLANVEFSVPVTDSTIFSINSITKVFTGTAIMQLVEEGKINIDEPIGDYLDSLPISWRQITLKQLLGHISGLPDIDDDFTGGLVGNKGEDTAWKIVQTMPLQSKPGELFYYNATNYLLLQKIIEKYEHSSFEQDVQQHQLNVVGMPETIFANSFDVIKEKAPTYTYYYQDKNTGEHIKGNQLIQVYENFPKILRADAGMFSTANEMGQWIIALQKHQLIKDDKNIETMWKPVILNNGKTEGFGGILNGYALGWLVVDRSKHPAVAAVGGGRAGLMIYPKDNLAIILFTNLGARSVELLIDKIAELYFETKLLHE